MMVQLRPQIIPLIEALNIYDEEIPSSIGNKYGDIHELQLELAKGSRLNKNSVHSAWMQNMAGIVQAKL